MVSLINKFISFLTISRSKIQIATMAHPTLGLFLAISSIFDLNLFAIVFFILYMLLITFACNINCYSDYEIDIKYKRELANAIDELGRKTIQIILIIEGILIILLISILIISGFLIVGILASLGFIFAVIYSIKPIKMKKRGILSPIPVIIGLYLIPLLAGWLMISNSFPFFIILFMCGYVLLNEGITLINTAEDFDEDLAENVRTWAHQFGIQMTLKIAFFFTLIGGINCILGLFLKIIQFNMMRWSFWMSCGFLIISGITVILTSRDIYMVGKGTDLKESAKIAAKNMPKWFIITRYPMLFTSIFLIL